LQQSLHSSPHRAAVLGHQTDVASKRFTLGDTARSYPAAIEMPCLSLAVTLGYWPFGRFEYFSNSALCLLSVDVS
jgi:hypothetical protein